MDPGLLKAAKTGDVALFKSLMDAERIRQSVDGQNNRIILATTAGGNTALHVAAKLGHIDFAREIVRFETSLLLQQNSRGDSPLHYAARAGHEDVVSLFLRSPVNQVEFLGLRNRAQNTALYEAVLNDHVGVVEKMVKEQPALASLVNDAGISPLYLAAERTSLDMVAALLQYCSLASAFAGPNGQTALHAAVLRSHEITELILRKKSNLLREADATGSTPLHYAASNGDLSMVQLLLEHDPSAVNLKDNDGLSAIHVAASMGQLDMIKFLIKHNSECIELVDNRGRNLLHVAIEKKRLHVVKYTLWTPELVDLLNEPDYEGNTPLHSAILIRNWNIVHILLRDKRVQTDIMNNKGLTPLDLASLNNESGVALRMYKIMVALVAAGSRFSPRRLDLVTSKLQRNPEEEINRCRTLANNLAIVAVLIATVSFAAAFTLPGGYKSDPGSDQGMAVLAKNWAFRLFLMSDAGAMVSSIVAACALIYTGSQDHDVRLHSLGVAMRLMWVALGGMVVAFATGTYVVVASDCIWLGVLVCVMACSAPFLVWLTTLWPTFNLASLRTMNPAKTGGKVETTAGAGGPHTPNASSASASAKSSAKCSPLLHNTPEAMNPLMSTTYDVVSSRMPRQIHTFKSPSPNRSIFPLKDSQDQNLGDGDRQP